MGICVSCRRRERKAPEKRWVPAKGAAAELLPRQIRLPTMANSISNIKMTNPIKGMVSKRRKRYVKDGFNLDLAYITDRIIAMGFPAEKLEGVYRNHIDEVYRFLEQMHKGHYMIYNLCAERKYDAQKFHDRVKKFEFEDHAPPKIEQIQPFCESVHAWLNEDSRNVAAVHCKAGKGRTGTMVCCYLLYSGQKATADEALKFYGKKRTHDEKGVTIPSQRRYVEYYAALVSGRLAYRATRVHVRELRMSPPPALNGGQCTLELVVSQVEPQFKASLGSHELRRHEATARVALQACTPLQGDIKVDVYCKPKMMMRKEKLFHFWFNTFFVTASVGATPVPAPNDSPNLETFKLTLDKWQLDDAHKDKQHKLYSPEFKVELIIQKQPDSSTFSTQSLRAPSTPSSASTCSENDEHWDSGEGFTPADHSVDTPLYSVDAPFYSTETPLYGDSEQSVQTPLYSISGVSMVQSDPVNTPLYSISSDGCAPLYGHMQPEVSTLRDVDLSVKPPLYTQVPRLNIPVNEPLYITKCTARTDVLTPPLYTLTSNKVGVEPVLPYQLQNNCLNRPLCTNDKTIFEPTISPHCKHNYNLTTVANESILSGAAPALSNTKKSTSKKSPLLSYKFIDGQSETPLYFVPCNNVLCTKLHKLCNLQTDQHSNKLFYDGNFKSRIASNKFSLDKSDCESPYINIVCGPNCHRQFVSDGQKSEKKGEISNNCTLSGKLHSDWCEGSIKNKRSSDSDMYEMLHESEQCHKKPNCQNINELSLLKLPTDKTDELVDSKVYSKCSSELTDNNLYTEKNDVYFPVDNTEYVEMKSDKPVESSAKSKNVKKEKCRDVSKSRLLGDMRASWREFSGKFGENRKKKHRDD